ncbi:hypothetical protein SAMN02799624_05326 [Paenibacillus sp. UNC496MF]|uniref:hypothetical protein n=1 Tax=Paenibacillus sp. UNC496MF TaxID=1502753 RepID=UPI0008F0AD6E|nr:hypothetical protein [Paenibacillus sp. UNC496MF]SFJ64201.1 hypothetical protein SAMN02799624_05326 [Paenibacillus sp. UNC496MF]
MKINVQFKLQHVYFAMSPRADEIEVIRRKRPENLLMSYALWRHQDLSDFVAQIGYRPHIMIDCGAYTFNNQGRSLGIYDVFEMYGNQHGTPEAAASAIRYDLYALDPFVAEYDERGEVEEREDLDLWLLHHYVEWVDAHSEYIDQIVVLDDRHDPDMTLFSYYTMRALGHNVLPVFHYGHDFRYLDEYVVAGADYIALGGSVGIKPSLRAAWANQIAIRYPAIKFHLLGTLDKKRLIDKLRGIFSVDGTAWNTSASFVRDRGGRSKVEQAMANVERMADFAQKGQLDIYYTLF